MTESSSAPRRQPDGAAARRPVAWLVALTLVLGILGPIVAPLSPAAAAPTASNRWTFDAGTGTTAADSRGSRPLTLSTGATWSTTPIQGASALALNGSTGAATSAGSVLTTSSSYTVSAWVKLSSTTGYQTVVSQDGTSASGFYLGLRGDNGRLSFAKQPFDSNAGTASVAAAAAAPVVGQWYHLVGVSNVTANTMALYVNGRLQSTVTSAGNWNATGNLTVGRAKFNGGSVDWVNGAIDDVSVYPTALSETEVEQLTESAHWKFEEGSGTTAADDSANNYPATLTNGPTWTPGEIGTTAVLLDGSNDTVTTTTSVVDTSKSFAVSAWARADGSTTGSTVVASVDGTSASGFSLQLGTGGRWAFTRASANVTSPTYTTALSTAAAVTGTWYHVVGVYDSVAATLTLYVNGAKQQTVSYTTGWRATGTFVIGRNRVAGAAGNYWNGAVDDVRAYSYVPDDASVLALAGTVPSAPAAPTAVPGTASATVSWSAPASNGGSNVTRYVITPYRNGVAQTAVSYDASTTTRTLTGLTAGASYTFTVTAVNPIGPSTASVASAAVTPYDLPGAPTITAVAAGSERVTVSWSAPASDGGTPITGYVVTPYVGSTAQTAQTFSGTATTQTVTGLTAGTSYTFRVAAVNAVGTGPQSAASAAVTPNTGPTITSGAPPAAQVGTAYSFTFTRSAGTSPFSWSVSAGSLPPGLTLASTTGVLSGTPTTAGSYAFSVRVTDASGYTDTRAVTVTVTGRPEAPAAPTATAGLTSAVLSWTAPATNGAPITGYVITPYRDGSAQPTITVDPSARTRTLNGLTAGASYTFTVAAVNSNGTSSASPASNAVTPYAALNAPTITAVTAGSTSATLSWTAPTSTGGSAITGYVVTPYIGSTAQTPQTFTGTATTRTLTGLTPGTAYTFTVAARNNSGTTVVHRLASAGTVTAIDSGPNWVDNGTYRSGSSDAFNFGGINSLDSTVPATTPPTLFYTERYANDRTNELAYAIPVTAGAPITVRLYFANQNLQTGGVGDRVFNVALDGSTVLPNFDIVAATGGSRIGTMREFAVVSDGTVNLDFGYTAKSDPVIYGIEILQTGTATVGPPSSSSAAVTPNASPTLTFPAPPAGQINVAYSHPLTVTGGTSPFTWSVSAGTLPAGLTLGASSGVLSGTPTAAGTFEFTVRVVDASGESATRAVSLVIAAAPVVTFSPATGEVNVPYSQQPTVTGGTGPFSWAVTAGSLPTGLSLNATTGLISGTPTTAGTFSVTLRVTDSFGQTASRSVSLVIAPLPTLTSTPPSGRFGVQYSFTFTATGGIGPFTYSVTAGTLPTGVTLSSAGVLSGNPRQIGTFPFTVRAVDANGQTATRSTALVVEQAPVQVSYSANRTSAAPGDVVTYTVTATNVSTTTYSSVEYTVPLSAVLDDATSNADVAVSAGTVNENGTRLLWVVDMTAGETRTLTYSVTVRNPDPGNKILSSTISSSRVSSTCFPGDTDPSCSPVVTVSGLSVTTTADAATTTPGATVAFSLAITNTGQTPFTGTTVSQSLANVLDDASYNGNATATAGSVSYANPTLTWTGTLAVGATVTVTYSVTVANPASGNRSLTATAVSAAAGSTCPSGNPAAACTATVTVLVPALSITNTAGVSTTTPGSTVAYTVVVANTGQTAYPAGTTVTVALTGALDDAGYVNANATTGTVAFDAGAATLTWTGALAVGASVTITYAVTVLDPDPGNKTLTTVASSSAAGSTCPVGSGNPACTSTVTVLVPALTLTVSGNTAASNPSTTTPGSTVTSTVLVTNTGQTAYSGAAFAADLSGVLDDATYVSASATSGTVSFSTPTLSWTGNLAVGASATITYTVTVADPDLGNRSLSTRVSSTTQGNNCPTGSTDARCVSTVSVLVPALSVGIAADVATTTPGSVLRYTVTATNTGETTYANLPIRISYAGAVDDGVLGTDGVLSTGVLEPNAGPGYAQWTLTLAPGETATASVSFTVNNPDLGDRSIVHAVTADVAGSSCRPAAPAPGCTSTVPVLLPGLTLTKTADRATVQPGGVVTYTVTVQNTGETAYPAAGFTDALGQVLDDAVYAGGATASVGTVSVSGSTLSWTGALGLGASATVSYAVTVRDPDPGDKLMTNRVVSTSQGSNCGPASNAPACVSRVDVLVPGLRLVKSASVATTVPGAVVGYTVTVTNTGDTAYTGATFSDSLAAVLDDATYNGNAAATVGTASYAGGTVSWSGNLAVGASATVTYSVTVRAADVGNDLLSSTLVSSTPGANCPAGGTDGRCTVVVPVARLTIEQSNPGPTTTPGSVLSLTVTFTNTGQVPYTGITISTPGADVLDDAISAGNQAASSGSLSVTEEAIVWTGSIPVGGVVTITGNATVKDAADLGNRRIVTPWVSNAPGNNCPPGNSDRRCTVSITVLVPALSISKASDAGSVVAGGVVAYTVTIANTGETPYAGATVTDTLTGVLDDAAYNADAVASAGDVSFSSPTLTWTGDLEVGATVTVSYSVTAAEFGTGNQELLNVVTSDAVGSSCPTGTTADSCRSSVDVLTPRLTIAKTADRAAATLGSAVTYTVSVTNSGQTTYPAAAFTDSLAGVLDDADYEAGSATATRGTVAVASGAISWSGALTPGQVAVIRYTVTVANPASGDGTMTNVVVSDTARSNCAAASTDTRCTSVLAVTNATSLTLTKRADVTSAAAGDLVRFSVEVLNSTDATLTDVDVTDPLADLLDDATFNNDLAATSGTVSLSRSDLVWSGSVGAGATVTISYSVTVDGDGAGNELLRGTISSTAEPGSNNCSPGSTDARCAVSVGVASLDLWQYADVATATPGSVIQLTAVYTNTGQVPYTDISVVSPRADTSDDTIPTGEQSASSGTFLRTETAVIWTGDIPVGGSVTVIRTLRVRDPDPGNQVITATLSSDAAGNSCPSGTTNPRCTFVVDVLTPQLTITKTADRAATPTGGTAGFTIVVANTGQTPYAGATVTDDLTGVLDDAGYSGAAVDVGTLSYTAPTLTWTSDLAVGQSATITYSVTATDPGTGDKVMVNPVSSTAVGSTCPPGSTSSTCRAVVIVLTPALTISTDTDLASARPGDVVTSVVTVQNTGQTAYAAAEVTVPLGGLLDDATYNADAAANVGDVSVTGGVLTWTGSLGVGADATIAYSVTVDDPVSGGDFRLEQTATSSNSGSNCPVGSLDERCATSVPVASLQLTTVADRATTKPTDVVTYIGTFVNLGQVDYVGISISTSFVGALDDATYSGDATATSGSLVAVTGSGRITWTGDVPVGETVTVTGTLTVRNPNPGDQVMTTRTSSSAPATNCPTASTDPRCVTSTPVLTPSLTIVKTVDTATSTPGSVLGYTVTVSNDGQTAYDDATFTDSLADVLTEADYLGDATATVGTVDFAAPELDWTGDLAVGESAVITYSVRIDDPDLGDKMIGNAVVSDELGSSCPTGGGAAACRTMVTVLVPALAIDVTADQTATTPGSSVDYTVTVANTGQTAYAGANVTISLAGVLDDATFGGTAVASSGTVGYSSPALTWTGDLAVGATATITYRVEVKNRNFGDRLLQTSVFSAEAGSSCPSDSSCSNVVAVQLPGLAITTTADRDRVTPGDRVTFSFTITNTGELIYPGTSVSTSLADVLDDGALAGSFRVSRGTVDYQDSTLTWTGTLLLGQSAVVSYDVDVDDPDTGNRSLVSTMYSGAAGSTCPADTLDPLCTASVTVLVPSLAISKTAGAPTTTPGGVVTYTIVVRNDGETDYVGAQVTDSLSGVLTDADYNDDVQVTGEGTVDYQEPVLTWTGDLPIGASAAITYSVTVRDPPTGDKLLVNAVTSEAPGSSCPRADAQPSCSVGVTVLVPELELTKSVDRTTVTAGDAVRYTVTVTNTGETDYAAATFTDTLTEVLDDGDYVDDSVASVGTVDYADEALVWTGSLAVGASASVTYSVLTDFPATGDGVLSNAVASDSPGSSCRAGTEDGCRTEVGVVVPELTVTKTADASEIVAGGRIAYTLTATNTGAADYPAATLTDALTGVLDDGVYREDGVATVGVLDDADGTIRWSGPLAVGASVVITFSVDVDLAGAGDAVLTNTVESATRGSTCPTGTAASPCTSTVPVIARSITISDLAPSFTLTGPPGSVVSRDEAVNLTVATNSAGGYVVTVQGQSDTMTPTEPGNSDTIPLNQLSVRPSGSTAPYEPLSQQPLTVHRANGPSAPNGDAIGNDYQVEIPFVNTDTYTTTLEYIATVQ